MTVRFDEVVVIGRKIWKTADGKRRQKTKRFWQTLNPFNKNPDGTPKTRDQILVEIRVQRDAWLAQSEGGAS